LEEIAEERRVPLEKYLEYVINIEAVYSKMEAHVFFELYRSLDPIKKTVIIALPDTDFDVTQASVTWKILKSTGINVAFATEHGAKPTPNSLQLQKANFSGTMVTLHPAFEARRYFFEMEQDPSFSAPIPFSNIEPDRYAGMVVVGGHFEGVRPYLENTVLQSKILLFWKYHRPLGAIAQGILILAHAKDPATSLSLLYNSKTTSYPKYLEYWSQYTPFWTQGPLYQIPAELEVQQALASPLHYFPGPTSFSKDSLFTPSGFFCQDDRYLSAGWEGDCYTFAKQFSKMVREENK